MKGAPWLGGSITQGHWRRLLQVVGQPSSCRKRSGAWNLRVQGSLVPVQSPQRHPQTPAQPAHLSFVPRTATVETAGPAVAVVTATMGPGGTATASTPVGAGAGLALLTAVEAASGGTAPARVEVASEGAEEVGPGSVLAALWAGVGSVTWHDVA